MVARSRMRPTGLRRVLYGMPLGLYRVGLGWLLGHRFVLIHHLGRKSGRWRQVVVEAAERDQTTGAITVMAGFGTGTDWYRNLLAHPDARIQLGKQSTDVRAAPLTSVEAGEAIERYARRHPWAARAMLRFLGLPVDGSGEAHRAAGRAIPALRLEPVRHPGWL
jgi:deazaflavin-dependent oxidoreductase (nitroreductase family)